MVAEGRALDGNGQYSRGRNTSLYTGALADDAAWVGGGGVVASRRTDCVSCECGCGQTLPSRDARGRPRRFVRGHHNSRRKVDWDARIAKLNSDAPLCACGCGCKLRVRADLARARIRNYQWPRFLRGHHAARADRSPLSYHVLGLVYGTLLGDSALARNEARSEDGTNPALIFNHGPKQEGWARLKAQQLCGLAVNVKEVANGGHGRVLYRGASIAHPSLREVACIIGRPKRVNAEWLDRIHGLGWAWWYFDDGSCERGGITFHTEGFPQSDVEQIAEHIKERFDVFGNVRLSKGCYWIIRLRVPEAIKWVRIMRKLIRPSQAKRIEMGYKVPDGYERGRRPGVWGARIRS